MKKIFFLFFSMTCFFLFGCQLEKKTGSFISPNQEINNEIEMVNLALRPEETKIPRLLDGVLVEEDKGNLLPVAVMLDNFPGAPRPSLALASIVFEAPVEGGLTRFLAIFDSENLPGNLGPIRSARPYFAELAEEYKVLYIHAGGSNDALFKLKQGFYQLFNLDEISWQTKYFWRSQEPAPHNLYIQKEQIQNFLEDQKINKKIELAGWQFGQKEGEANSSADLPSEGLPKEGALAKAEEVKINFSSLSVADWRYNGEGDEYQLFKKDQIYKDKDGQVIGVKNLIIQYAKITILDSIGRRKIELTGQGEAEIFQNGQITRGKWLKEAGRTRFYNDLGEEIVFLPGKTWVSIVSNASQVSY